MPNYRRNRVPGGTYFFTVNLLKRKSTLLTEHIAELREAVRIVQKKQPFHIDAWVVLPDHMHAIWTLPPGDDRYSTRWQAIKKAFTKAIPKTEYRSQIRINRHERIPKGSSGKGVFGSIRFTTKRITPSTWIIFTTIRSKTAGRVRFQNGLIQVFIAWSRWAFIHRIGQVWIWNRLKRAKGEFSFLIGGWHYAYPPYGPDREKLWLILNEKIPPNKA